MTPFLQKIMLDTAIQLGAFKYTTIAKQTVIQYKLKYYSTRNGQSNLLVSMYAEMAQVMKDKLDSISRNTYTAIEDEKETFSRNNYILGLST